MTSLRDVRCWIDRPRVKIRNSYSIPNTNSRFLNWCSSLNRGQLGNPFKILKSNCRKRWKEMKSSEISHAWVRCEYLWNLWRRICGYMNLQPMFDVIISNVNAMIIFKRHLHGEILNRWCICDIWLSPSLSDLSFYFKFFSFLKTI